MMTNSSTGHIIFESCARLLAVNIVIVQINVSKFRTIIYDSAIFAGSCDMQWEIM
jgi:hypothetical protein